MSTQRIRIGEQRNISEYMYHPPMIARQQVMIGAKAPCATEQFERFAIGNGITTCFGTFGDPVDETALLIMGLGGQMVAWHDDFCEQLAAEGPFHVVRFDNRDCGRSTHLDATPAPAVHRVIARRAVPPYTLEDLAADALALLDHLDVQAAHVIGASMGGAIAQTLALRAPHRVKSLVSIMSNTGSRSSGQPAPSMWRHLLRGLPTDRTRYVTQASAVLEQTGSRRYPADETWTRQMLGTSFDRGVSRDGYLRQLGAVLAAPDRSRALRRLSVPTLVIHGADDRLVRPSGGRATARAIPGTHLLELGGMGHDLPRALWPLIVSSIVTHARNATEVAA